MDFDGVVAAGADDGFGDAEAVNALVDDVDGFGELVGFLERFFACEGGVVDFEGKGDAAFEVEAEFDFTLAGLEEVAEEDFVAFIEVFDVSEVDFGEEGGEVDLVFFVDFGEGDEEGGGFVVLDTGLGFFNYLVEFKRLSSFFGFYVFWEWGIIHGEDIEDGP